MRRASGLWRSSWTAETNPYANKRKRRVEHIDSAYEDRQEDAQRRAWATVNKDSGDGN
jgi:hypothetical protein